MPDKIYLAEMVKFCVLDSAIINGIPIDNYIGKVSKTVVYNDVSIVVNVDITVEDIEAYYEKKASQHIYYS